MRWFLFVAAIFFGLATTPADAEFYTFDKAHTTIQFAVSNFDVFSVTGEFTQYDGSFVFCRRHPEKDRIAIALYAPGIRTGDDEQDEEIQGPDFFNAAQFPRLSFTSTHIRFLDANTAEITGKLTLLGVTRPVVFHAHFLGMPEANEDGGDDDYLVNFAASAIIHRSDFSMDYLSPFIVGDDVHIDIQARGVKSDEGDEGDEDAPAQKSQK